MTTKESIDHRGYGPQTILSASRGRNGAAWLSFAASLACSDPADDPQGSTAGPDQTGVGSESHGGGETFGGCDLPEACEEITSGQTSTTDLTTSSTATTSDATSASSDEATSDEDSSEDTTTDDVEPSLDERLAALLVEQETPVVPIEAPPAPDPALYELGRALFFDPILSGNKDIACATCHHPTLGSGDGLSMGLGTGATGLGPERAQGDHRPFIPRHSPTLFNVGDPAVKALFWDGRVERLEDGSLKTPAGDQLPEGLDDQLAAQALFPLLDRGEMRGRPGDRTIFDEVNELSVFLDEDRPGIWSAVMTRLRAIAGYRSLMTVAFPGREVEALQIADIANAIAAFEREAFSLTDTPWDAYLRGDLQAISDEAKRGAIEFCRVDFTHGGCGKCHTGALFSDQLFQDSGIPQIGFGHPDSAPFDLGRAHATDDPRHRFQFRTPTLRDFAASPPFMHNGSLADIGAVLRHYQAPSTTAGGYDPSSLHHELVDTWQHAEDHLLERQQTFSELVSEPVGTGALLSIAAFLETLRDPSLSDLPAIRPDSVPSGLPVPRVIDPAGHTATPNPQHQAGELSTRRSQAWRLMPLRAAAKDPGSMRSTIP